MNRSLFNLFESGINIMEKMIYIIISLAMLAFFWGVVKIIFNSANPKSRQDGRSYMIYGILTLFVMTSVWGIVYLFRDIVVQSPSGQPKETVEIDQGKQKYGGFDNFEDLNKY